MEQLPKPFKTASAPSPCIRLRKRSEHPATNVTQVSCKRHHTFDSVQSEFATDRVLFHATHMGRLCRPMPTSASCPVRNTSLRLKAEGSVEYTGGGSNSSNSTSVISKIISENRSFASLASAPSSLPSNSIGCNFLFLSSSMQDPGGG